MMSQGPTLRSSCNARLTQSSLGRSISLSPRRDGWQHPWFTVPMWLPKTKKWSARVLAGCVNGVSPMVRVTAGELRDARGTFYGQLVDANTGAAEIKQLALLAIGDGLDAGTPDNAQLVIPLCQNPPIGLNSWRAIGWDGAGRVPQFFLDRGVNRPSAAIRAASDGGQISGNDVMPPKGNRLLRACDIIVHQPRVGLTSQMTYGEPLATGDSVAQQILTVVPPADKDFLKINIGTFDQALQNGMNYSGGTSLLNNYEEKTWDEILVSTVYVMSPPDAALDSEPDETWQAFVRHGLFWNLSWAQPDFHPPISTSPFGALVAIAAHLGSGAGSFAVNYIAASIDDMNQAAVNLLTASSMAGSFWTSTGGGTTSAYPAVPAAKVSPGLDKAATAAAKARAAAAAKRRQQLDPDFPYEGIKFNRSLLNK